LMGDTIMNMHLGGLRGLEELNRDILIKDNEV